MFSCLLEQAIKTLQKNPYSASDTLQLFVSIHIPFWARILSTQRVSLNIYCQVSLLAVNPLRLYFSKKVCISPSSLNTVSVEHRTLGLAIFLSSLLLCFSFVASHCLLRHLCPALSWNSHWTLRVVHKPLTHQLFWILWCSWHLYPIRLVLIAFSLLHTFFFFLLFCMSRNFCYES